MICVSNIQSSNVFWSCCVRRVGEGICLLYEEGEAATWNQTSMIATSFLDLHCTKRECSFASNLLMNHLAYVHFVIILWLNKC